MIKPSLLHNLAKYTLYALLFFAPLARGSVLPWQQTMIQIFTVAMVSLLLLGKAISPLPSSFPRTDLDKPILALLSLTIISLLFSQSSPESWDAVGLLLTYIAIFYATTSVLRTRTDQRELIYIILTVATVLCSIGILKYCGAKPPWWTYDDLNYSKALMSSAYGNHNHFAGYLEMAIPLLLSLFLTRTRKGVWRFVLFCMVLLFAICQILTLSRGGWFSLAFSLTVITVVLLFTDRFKRKKALLITFASGIVIAIMVLSGSTLFERALSLTDGETVLGMNGRVQVWKATLQMIKEYWPIGSGPGTYSTVFPQFQLPGTLSRFYFAHNDYLHFIAELGIGFIPIMGWFLYALFNAAARKLASDSRQTWGIALGAFSGILAVLFHSFVDFNLHIPANAVLFVVLAALIAGKPAPLSSTGQQQQDLIGLR